MPRTQEAFEAMRQTTKQKIEAAALSLFARKGLSVTVGEIARFAGVSQGLMYSHYPSKDALIAELARQANHISSDNILILIEGDDTAAAKIKQTTSIMCRMFTNAPIGIDYFMFMVQVGMSGFQIPEASQFSIEHPNPIETFANVIAQGQAEGCVVPGDPLRLSTVYWAVIQGLCCYSITGVSVPPDLQMLNRILLKENFL